MPAMFPTSQLPAGIAEVAAAVLHLDFYKIAVTRLHLSCVRFFFFFFLSLSDLQVCLMAGTHRIQSQLIGRNLLIEALYSFRSVWMFVQVY